MDLIGKAKFKVAIDSMYGSGRGILAEFSASAGFSTLPSGRN